MILLAICTCQKNADKRQAVRDAWFPRGVDGMDARFFMGRGEIAEEEDTVVLDVADDYMSLPAKVVAFFRHALEHFQFDWLFKCDDDTFVAVERLRELAELGCDAVSNPSVLSENFMSGGAGYLLRRWVVEKIVEGGRIPDIGFEDRLVSAAAFRFGAVVMATGRLGDELGAQIPRRNNDHVTCHWISPSKMRALHVQFTSEPLFRQRARHSDWEDDLLLYEGGICWRGGQSSGGLWLRTENDGIEVRWFDHDSQRFFPVLGGDVYVASDCMLESQLSPEPAVSATETEVQTNTRMPNPVPVCGEYKNAHQWRLVLGSDMAGIEPNATLVASLLAHCPGTLEVRILSRDVEPVKFTSGRLALEVIRTPEALRFSGQTQAHVHSEGAFDRIAAIKCCPDWDRAVMMDYDQLVIGDPRELFEMELGEALAAVRLWPGVSLGHACREFVGRELPERWRHCEEYRFFHMGPVLNLAAMRNAGTYDRFVEFHRDCKMEEQVALCAACEDRVIGFDLQLNAFPIWNEINGETRVAHYYGSEKPWNNADIHGAGMWRAVETTWRELTFGLWNPRQMETTCDAGTDVRLAAAMRALRVEVSPLRVLELGGWDLSRMVHAARQWLRAEHDRWHVVFRPHVDPIAREQAIARFGEMLRGLAPRTEIMDGESAEILGWLLTQNESWEAYDAVIIHAPRNPSTLLTEAMMAWKLLRPGGLMVVHPVSRHPGNVAWNAFGETVSSFAKSVVDGAIGVRKKPMAVRPGHPVCLEKLPSDGMTDPYRESALKVAEILDTVVDDETPVVRTLVLEMQGRLGNQMFQYAHGLALSRRLGASLHITHEYGAGACMLKMFGIHPAADIPPTDITIEHNGECRAGEPWAVEEAILASGEFHVKLRGFFQNEGCFETVADEVRKLFTLPLPNPVVPDGTPVCVHVRRGDFVDSPIHEVCTPEYYDLAIRVMATIISEPRFFVISDDPLWCTQNLASRDDMTVLELQDVPEVLATMIACKAFVLSNSTLGWWGAWLGKGWPVIAPTRFLNDRDWDICPDHWIRLPGNGGLSGGNRGFDAGKAKFILISYPRSGNHLARFIIEYLTELPTSGCLDNPDDVAICRNKFPGDRNPLWFVRSAAAPICQKVHRKEEVIAASHTLTDNCGLIFILRHPLECILNHSQSRGDLDPHVSWYLDNIDYFMRYAGRKLLVEYESMIDSPVRVINEIAGFLSAHVVAERLSELVENYEYLLDTNRNAAGRSWKPSRSGSDKAFHRKQADEVTRDRLRRMLLDNLRERPEVWQILKDCGYGF